MNLYGLIGYPLTHSFSQRYFTEKFAREGIADSRYELFEMPDVTTALPDLLKTPGLRGLNVTIPYKQAVLPYLDRLDASAEKVGAVNVIKLEADGSRTGYNSDYYGFRRTLEQRLDRGMWEAETPAEPRRALVLGTGGASKAVVASLTDMGVPYQYVSRTKSEQSVTYAEAASLITTHHLIINCSPVGTYPRVAEAPDLPYEQLTDQHILYDLVYNPAETRFMQLGRERGAYVMNGYQMLVLQAEKAWEIWQSADG